MYICITPPTSTDNDEADPNLSDLIQVAFNLKKKKKKESYESSWIFLSRHKKVYCIHGNFFLSGIDNWLLLYMTVNFRHVLM